MTHPERIEKNRQAIMRYRELLDILQQRIAEAERYYETLFAGFGPEERAQTPVKELQRRIGAQQGDDVEALARQILNLRFVMHDLAKEFEALHDRLTEPIIED